jgi:hypothetical protein
MSAHLFRLVHRLSEVVCGHPEGIVCSHRQYEYDLWQRGYGDGFTAGRNNMEAKWRGSVYGTGPYAGYPVPARGPENAPDATEEAGR